jgi:hypothetical protein
MEKRYSLPAVWLGAILVLATGATTSWTQEAPAGRAATSAAPGVLAPAGDISGESLTPKILEDWTTPSLTGSDLELSDAVPGDIDTIDGVYTHQVIRVQWRPADPIDLYIIKPVGVKKPPVVLYLYSYPFETDRFLQPGFCKFLVRNGFAAVGFASALTGHRYHDRPMKQWFVSELRESLATSAHDVQMILTYLTSRGDIDMNRVGMFGDGSGASIAILAAAADPRIKTLDLLNPWGDWPDWIAKSTRVPENERPGFLKPEWLESVAPIDPVKWLPELKTQKVRIQFVKTLPVTPADVQKKIAAAAPASAEIVHYDDLAAFRGAVADGTGFDWLKRQVRGVGPAEYHAGRTQSKSASVQAKDSQR